MRKRVLGLGMAVAFAVCLALSIADGAPKTLPGAALDSPIVLYVERAAGLFIFVVAVAALLTQAWSGRLPTEFSREGFKFAEAKDVTARALEEVVSSVEETKDATVRGLEAVVSSVNQLESRVDSLEVSTKPQPPMTDPTPPAE